MKKDRKETQIYKKIKRQNGEGFARVLRENAPTIFEHDRAPEILEFAGSDPEDVKKLSPVLHRILFENENREEKAECPIKLLGDAGYDAYVVTDKKSQDRIKKYYKKREELCTFGTDRYKHYKIINAVKRNAGDLVRSDFKTPKRDDEYGTSVISIQVRDGFISIKNRYNSTVPNCDATFNNNLDAIIPGLHAAVEQKFNIKIAKGDVPDGFMMCGDQIFKVLQEVNGIYYGENAVLRNGAITRMLDNEFLYNYFVFDIKSKTLRLFDDRIKDSFPSDFNKYYGGLQSLRVDAAGNLLDGDTVLFDVVG